MWKLQRWCSARAAVREQQDSIRSGTKIKCMFRWTFLKNVGEHFSNAYQPVNPILNQSPVFYCVHHSKPAPSAFSWLALNLQDMRQLSTEYK